jgi:hypothetical protein
MRTLSVTFAAGLAGVMHCLAGCNSGRSDAVDLPTARAADRDSVAADMMRGARWLAARVQSDGRVDSRGNARICGGGESFLGEAKGLALPSVVIGLARVGVNGGQTADRAIIAGLQRVSAWARANSGADACFEGA